MGKNALTGKPLGLLITRRIGERILVTVGGHEIWVTVAKTSGGRATVAFLADLDVDIVREELLEKRLPGHERP